jgi:hypothetical protein
MKLGLSRRIFEKYSNFKKPRPVETRFPVRTDRHDEANSRFLQFCEYAQKWQFIWIYNFGKNRKIIYDRIFSETFVSVSAEWGLVSKYQHFQCEGTKQTNVVRTYVKSWNSRGDSKFCSSIWTAKAQEKWKSLFLFWCEFSSSRTSFTTPSFSPFCDFIDIDIIT